MFIFCFYFSFSLDRPLFSGVAKQNCLKMSFVEAFSERFDEKFDKVFDVEFAEIFASEQSTIDFVKNI